mgnify:CR=1 FL=1
MGVLLASLAHSLRTRRCAEPRLMPSTAAAITSAGARRFAAALGEALSAAAEAAEQRVLHVSADGLSSLELMLESVYHMAAETNVQAVELGRTAAIKVALHGATPVAQRAGAAQAAVTEPPLAPVVLVVDDSLTVRRVTERMLLREGYRVTLAKDGLDAMERLAQEKPAIVLSDIEMPRMDGFDLVRNLRADPLLHDLPVIMITSRIAQKHREHAAQLGVDHYLGKPYSEEDLLALISQCTGHLIEAHGT